MILITLMEFIGIALLAVFALVILGFLLGLGFWTARFYIFEEAD